MGPDDREGQPAAADPAQAAPDPADAGTDAAQAAPDPTTPAGDAALPDDALEQEAAGMGIKEWDTGRKRDDQDGGKVTIPKPTFYVLVAAVIVAVGAAAFLAGTSAAAPDTLTQKDIDDAIARLELRMLQERLPTAQPGAPEMPVRISADDDPIIGSPDAPITIIEFSDFQCPFCARFYSQTLPPLTQEYIDQGTVKLVFRDFPIQGIHPNALPASAAAECANEQGKFKEMHDTLFERQSEWSGLPTAEAIGAFSGYAGMMQLDQATFDSCVTEGKYIEEIAADLQAGQSYGVSGTPGFFVGNDELGYVEIKGAQPFESFKRVIDAQLGS